MPSLVRQRGGWGAQKESSGTEQATEPRPLLIYSLFSTSPQIHPPPRLPPPHVLEGVVSGCSWLPAIWLLVGFAQAMLCRGEGQNPGVCLPVPLPVSVSLLVETGTLNHHGCRPLFKLTFSQTPVKPFPLPAPPQFEGVVFS